MRACVCVFMCVCVCARSVAAAVEVVGAYFLVAEGRGKGRDSGRQVVVARHHLRLDGGEPRARARDELLE